MDRLIFISDLHIGLETDDVDRFPEIRSIFKKVVKTIKGFNSKGDKTTLVIGGDIFDRNTPSEIMIANFIGLLNLFKKMSTPIYIMSGNHDSISEYGRYSCLSFVKRIAKNYPNIHLIDKIKNVKLCDSDKGPVYMLFLPHINMAHIERTNFKNVNSYIRKKVLKAYDKMGKEANIIALSHLEVTGAKSNDMEIVSSGPHIPSCLTSEIPLGYSVPLIISGHYHTPQVVDNVHIVGAPIHTRFTDINADDGDRFFAVINIEDTKPDLFSIEYIVSNTSRFYSVDLNLLSDNSKLDKMFKHLKNLTKKDFLKINPTLKDSEVGLYNWHDIKLKIEKKYGCTVKDIVPNIVRTRIVRNKNQQIGLDPIEAVRVFIESMNPSRKKEKLALAEKYLDRA